jgi:hypothetical protein
MHSFLFKFTIVLNSVLSWKLLVSEFLLGISETLLNASKHVGEEMSREVHGPVTEKGVWRKGSNQELEEFCKTPDLVMDIKRRRLKFLEHMNRVDQAMVTTNIFENKPERKRKLGRPNLR